MLDQIAEKIKFDDDDRLNAFDYEYESLNLYCCYLTSQKASYFDDFFFNRIYLFFEAAARHNHVKCLDFVNTVWTLYLFFVIKKVSF